MPLFSKFSSKQARKLESADPPPKPSGYSSRDNGAKRAVVCENAQLLPVFDMKYTPLDSENREIRLLLVLKGEHSNAIRCTLWKTSLPKVDDVSGSYIPYETISYTWGERQPAVISIDGVLVTVTKSAAEVLHRIRSPAADRMIWIDAICINQNDLLEQAQQVRLMALIYNKGTRNIVWLGHNDHSDEYLKQEVHRTILNMREHTQDYQNFSRTTHDDHCIKQDGQLLDPSIDLEALRYIFAKPWFRRLWIAQEVAVAARNVCHIGYATFDLTDILKIAVWLNHNKTSLSYGFAEKEGIAEAVTLWYLVDRSCVPKNWTRSMSHSLFSLWLGLRHFQVSRAHDHVYAMLGLFLMSDENKQKYRAALRIDYRKDIQHVFRDATRVFIETPALPDVLQYRSLNVCGLPSLQPSWALDLRCQGENNPSPQPIGDFFRASGETKMNKDTYNAARDPNVLSLEGIAIDVVTERTGCFDMRSDTLFRAALNHAFDMLSKTLSGSPKDIAIKIARTLMADANWLSNRAQASDIDEFEAFTDYIKKHQRLPPYHHRHDIAKRDKWTQAAMRCFSCVVKACYKRCVFVTKGGLAGVGPGGLLPNDSIVILYGGTTPYALRRVSSNNWVFVGGCYVYGIMEGEAVPKAKAARRGDGRFDLI